jgi:PAS domain S-box-containing protein
MGAWLPLAVTLVGILLTFGSWYRARVVYRREVGVYFAFRTREAVSQIAERLHYYEQSLLATRGLLEASDGVTREEFATFAASLRLAERYPGILGIGYSVFVPAADKARHVAQVRGEGFPEYDIRPGGPRESYSSIVYLEPFAGRNLGAFGYDMSAEPVRNRAMQQARDTGRTSLSGRVTLVQESDANVQAGFLMYVPVYRKGGAVRTIEERRRNLVGWVYAPFRMNDLMHDVLGESGVDLDIEIYDGPDATAAMRMWDRDSTSNLRGSLALRSSETVSFGDRPWTIAITALPGLGLRRGGDSSVLVLIVGSLASLLLGALTLSLVQQVAAARQRSVSLEQRVEERTQALRESEMLFRTVADHTYDWELWTAPGGAVVYCSPSCERVTGYPAAAFVADPGLLDRLVHPDDLPAWSTHLAGTHNSPGAPEVAELDFRVLHRDGGWRQIGHLCRALSDAEGRPLGRRISNRDVTSRKLAEEALEIERWRLAGVIRGTDVGTWEWNIPTGTLVLNERWAGMIGYTLEELGPTSLATFEKYVQPDDLKRCLELLERHWRGEDAYYECELRMKHRNGTWVWVLARGALATTTEAGKPLVMMGTHIDISKRKQAETQLQNLAHDLELANGEMEDTLYAASHDLRSPLLNVRGFSGSLAGSCELVRDRLGREDVPDGVKKDLEPVVAQTIPAALRFIEAGGRRMDILLDGLLAVARARRVELHVAAVDMDGLMNQVRGAMAFQLQDAGATLGVERLPPCRGDGPALNRVFTNLLDNALKYRHPDRAPHIQVSGSVEEGRCVYRVRDNGLGIDPRHHVRIFKLFHRLDPTGPVEGEGLGLTLANRILNRLRGRVWVESNPDLETGSCFCVELPASATTASTNTCDEVKPGRETQWKAAS